MGTSANYPKVPYEAGQATGILQPDRVADKVVEVRRNLPGNIIVIHGVNDVGVGFGNVEEGLCEGLQARLKRKFTPASYSAPKPEDKNKLYDDPDAVFFKRRIDQHTDSPVIPFYWGYREESKPSGFRNGQHIDRYGNRLDKDLSKGGGPFSNATNTLPDLWNRGFSALPGDMIDFAARDPVRPVLKAPGRMYMVLAAQRLAALISMIRDYAPDDAVSIVAHSQGCLISLLAQAFLLEKNLRPADTLVLTHPPYSLVDDVPFQVDTADIFKGGEDVAMKNGYESLSGRQTFHARLQTLVNIVHGVVKARHASPHIQTFNDNNKHFGMVGGEWVPDKDRDNRGKVYLYFCPEDMTVALNNMQGIGWQGIPDEMEGRALEANQLYTLRRTLSSRSYLRLKKVTRYPLKELGAGFFQRVFTAKRRPDPKSGQAVPVGLPSPHDFVLRVKGEDDHAHVGDGAATQRVRLKSEQAPHRAGIRTITGEALTQPVPADMYAGGVNLPGQPTGAHEETDPIDAAIAVTSDYGLQEKWVLIKDPTTATFGGRFRNVLADDGDITDSPRPTVYKDRVVESKYKVADIEEALNQGKPPTQQSKVLQVFTCMRGIFSPMPTGDVLVCRKETPDEARLRWQNSTSPRSFHGAIFGSRANHANVSAYDVAIGGGKASSHPKFHAYLCAVADWRLKELKKGEKLRRSILSWDRFVTRFGIYWNAEPEWRRKIIEGNKEYYSGGILPDCLPVLPDGLPSTVISETTVGQRIDRMGGKNG